MTLSGRIEPEHLAELQDMIGDEAPHHTLVVDLKEVKLMDRDAVKFLAQCEARGIKLESCPAYVHEWIVGEGAGSASPRRKTRDRKGPKRRSTETEKEGARDVRIAIRL